MTMLFSVFGFGFFLVFFPVSESACVKETVNVFTVCITVWHTGNPPTYEEMAELTHQERLAEARPLPLPPRISEWSLSSCCQKICQTILSQKSLRQLRVYMSFYMFKYVIYMFLTKKYAKYEICNNLQHALLSHFIEP
ncbi:hypothetical protein Avbf_16750 [Armadillidium vulgare]|nr:hypothetical protein Avbf_16750 [Armadillidium vulgare]